MNKAREIAEEILSFAEKSPTGYHAVENIRLMLEKDGFTSLSETEEWSVGPGGSVYVTRNGSSLIAVRLPGKELRGFRITASHSDSPALKIKENPEIGVRGYYVKLNVEKYGGMLCAPWFDRPLTVAGRVMTEEDGRIRRRLVYADRDILMIPSLAIHMNRKVNEGVAINPQTDMLPVFGGPEAEGRFRELLASLAGVKQEDILGSDIFLVTRDRPVFWGIDEEYIAGPRLDDLMCAGSTLLGFLAAEQTEHYAQVYCIFDNEEVGSTTRQGAASTFLADTLSRIMDALGYPQASYHRALAESFMVSADNAHAFHPNAPEKADPVNRPRMNGGIVLKYSANQKYTTDGMSEAVFKLICRENGIPYQVFTNRADLPGGSTLGNIASANVPVSTVDIGLAQLAMHSAYESAGAYDPAVMAAFARAVFMRGDLW